jgi:predicted homoserine dehydrogenase-like protein
MRLTAISNRRGERAVEALRYAGLPADSLVSDLGAFEDAAHAGVAVGTEDPLLLCRSEHVDVLVDVTGSVEYGARVALEAFANSKHVVLLNAELDATIGPILQTYADRHGVTLSACDGDEPGLQMNLFRWVVGLGLTPRLVVNVKGLQDPYRNPTTQQGFAEQWGQNPAMVTSFADGSKISFEQAIVANATGFKVPTRGMSRGRVYDGSIMDISELWDLEQLRELGGAVDYTVGPAGVKVFVLAEHEDPATPHLEPYKPDRGPIRSGSPYHLVHFEVPSAIARVVLFGDNVARPLGGPAVEVCAVAKKDLSAGETLDEYGMYATYGEAVDADEMSAGRYLPEGLVMVAGCRARWPRTPCSHERRRAPGGRIADSPEPSSTGSSAARHASRNAGRAHRVTLRFFPRRRARTIRRGARRRSEKRT